MSNNAGIRIYDQFGNLIIDGSTPILKLISETAITTSGSTSVASDIPAANNVIVAPTIDSNESTLPQLSVSGQSVSWSPMGGGWPLKARLNVMAF